MRIVSTKDTVSVFHVVAAIFIPADQQTFFGASPVPEYGTHRRGRGDRRRDGR